MPMKVPMVSKVSDRLKEKMVIRTKGILAASEKSDNKPSLPKAAPKVVPNSWKDLAMLVSTPIWLTSTTPMRIPMMVEAIMLMKIAPGTFLTTRIIMSNNEITARTKAGVVKLVSAGTPASKLIIPTFKKPI